MRNKFSIILVLLASIVLGQTNKDKLRIKEFFWGANDSYKNINTIPEKWKNESAVIIYKYENHDFHNHRINVSYTSYFRKKIMLLDQAAINEYSEFSFLDKIQSDKGYNAKQRENVFGAKIIKANGTVIEIDVEKESKVVDNVKKIAIANLEKGDIIDFYLYSEEKFKTLITTFPKVENILGEEYPIMNYKLNFVSENDFFINFNSYNGAPQLVQVPTDVSSDRKFEFEAKDIEKVEFSRWLYPLVELPCYKFQVNFVKSDGNKMYAEAFLSDKEKDIKKTVTKEDVVEAFKRKYFPNYSPLNNQEPPKKIFNDKEYSNVADKIRALYNYTRYLYFTRVIEFEVAKNNVDSKEFYYMANSLNAGPFYRYSDFFQYFTTYLSSNKIDYDLIIGTDKENGSIDDLLLYENLTPVLRVNTPTPLYIEYYTPFSGVDILNPGLEGSKAYVLKANKSKELTEINEIILPKSSAKDNISKSLTKVALMDDFSNFYVKRDVSFTGHFKADEQKRKIPFYEYVREDEKRYAIPSKKYGIPKKKEEIEKPKMKAYVERLKETNKENLTKEISEEFGAKIEDYKFELVNSGRYNSKDVFQFKEEFKINNDFIKRAGENYMVEIGKFISSQIEINKKEKERKNNIYMPFARAIENEIIFEIPNGYSVSGIEKLNKNVSNATGHFISKANLDGNILKITTSKQYNNNYEANSNWSKMIDFLEAAFQFTQEKVLLKKS